MFLLGILLLCTFLANKIFLNSHNTILLKQIKQKPQILFSENFKIEKITKNLDCRKNDGFQLCYINYKQKQIDFAYYFTEPTDCFQTSYIQNEPLESFKTCNKIDYNFKEKIFVNSNLELNRISLDQTSILAAAGFIKIKSLDLIIPNLKIIATGGVEIDQINAKNNSTLIIYSHLGQIKVDRNYPGKLILLANNSELSNDLGLKTLKVRPYAYKNT